MNHATTNKRKFFLLVSSVLVGTLLVVGAVSASTTISTDISTGGNLSVSGTSTLATTTVSNLTATGNVTVGNTFSVSSSTIDLGGSLTVTGAGSLGGGSYPPNGTTFTSNDYSLLVLNTPTSKDYSEQVLASHSDGFAGNQYDWGFVAQQGDVNPNGTGTAATGTLNYIGSIWMQMENTTQASSVDWGMDISSPGITNRPLMGNGVGDVGIGMTNSSYGGQVPTPVSTASIWISGATREVGIGVLQGAVTARLHVAPNASEVGEKIQRASGQSADLLDFVDSNGTTILSKLDNGGRFKSPTSTFSSIPSCNGAIEGMMTGVTDSTTNTLGATITGSGSNHVLAYCDGTNWTVMAK